MFLDFFEGHVWVDAAKPPEGPLDDAAHALHVRRLPRLDTVFVLYVPLRYAVAVDDRLRRRLNAFVFLTHVELAYLFKLTEADIHQLAAFEHVGRLEVAVLDVVGVEDLHTFGHVDEQLQNLVVSLDALVETINVQHIAAVQHLI